MRWLRSDDFAAVRALQKLNLRPSNSIHARADSSIATIENCPAHSFQAVCLPEVHNAR